MKTKRNFSISILFVILNFLSAFVFAQDPQPQTPSFKSVAGWYPGRYIDYTDHSKLCGALFLIYPVDNEYYSFFLGNCDDPTFYDEMTKEELDAVAQNIVVVHKNWPMGKGTIENGKLVFRNGNYGDYIITILVGKDDLLLYRGDWNGKLDALGATGKRIYSYPSN